MPDPSLAHAGHWLSGLIYLAPVALVVALIGLQQFKARRNPQRTERLREATLDEVMDGKDGPG